jgi:predicted ATPase
VNVSINSFIEARDKLPSAISTLPPGYLGGNAAALLAVVEELKNSLRLELRVIQAIKDVDVTQAQSVAKLTQDFENYSQSRDFDQERTHCHNIGRIVNTLLTPLGGGTQADRDRVSQVESLLNSLRYSDSDFLDDIEPIMNRALGALQAINNHAQAGQTDASRIAEARREQQAFVQEFGPLLDHLKTTLKQMNTLANDLIDRL